jgi:hypothetical protein
MENTMTITNRLRAASTPGFLSVFALAISVMFAGLSASCAAPSLVILAFSATTAPTLTASSASVPYSYSFTNSSEVADSDGLPVVIRLYRVTGATRVMAAEGSVTLKAVSGTGPYAFSISTTLVAGQYYVEFSFADDLGPQVIRTLEATLL